MRPTMARGEKSKYTEKQKRQAEHIEEGYEQSGGMEQKDERRAALQQDDWRGQKVGLGPRAAGRQGSRAERRKARWCSCCCSAGESSIRCGTESSTDKSAPQTRKRLRRVRS